MRIAETRQIDGNCPKVGRQEAHQAQEAAVRARSRAKQDQRRPFARFGEVTASPRNTPDSTCDFAVEIGSEPT